MAARFNKLNVSRLFVGTSSGIMIAIGGGTTRTDDTHAGSTFPLTAAAINATSDALTATKSELNILDGVTATAAELNKLDGVTASTSELNILTSVTATTAELNKLDGVTASTSELNLFDSMGATTSEINNVADVSARRQELTASGAVTAGKQFVELNHATSVVAATIANSNAHQGLFVVKNTSASGTAAHTLTLTAGTFDGTNNVATLNAPKEALVVYFDTNGDGTILENIGSVGLA